MCNSGGDGAMMNPGPGGPPGGNGPPGSGGMNGGPDDLKNSPANGGPTTPRDDEFNIGGGFGNNGENVNVPACDEWDLMM